MKQQLLKVLFVCMAIAFLPQVAHAGDVEINATNFPDEYFRNYLLQQDYGIDGKLTEEEIKEITSLWVSACEIRSLQGIEYFTALTMLDCYNNQLTALDVSKNTALTALSCSGNQLTALDVSKNTALTELWCNSNQLTALDVSKNTTLGWLSCDNNQLTVLDVSKNTALTELSCWNNQLTALDVSGCTALKKLSCYNNQLIALDVSKSTALTELYCDNNQLTALDVSRCTALTWLYCYNNQLTALDVSGCTALIFLFCNNNQLAALDVSGCTALISLNCYMNKIKGVAMDNFINSLPTQEGAYLGVYQQSTDEENVCTKKQVQAAKERGWIAYWQHDDQNWQEYEGSDDTPTVINDIRTEVGKDAPVYNLRGERLTAPQKGVNIIGGRKVVVK